MRRGDDTRCGTRRFAPFNTRLLFAVGAMIIASGAAAVFAGLGGFPVAREMILDGGNPVAQLVLNPEVNTEPTCDDPNGVLKIVTPTFAVVRSMSSFVGSSLGVIEQGELVTTLSQNESGWWHVSLPATCAITGWVPENTFETLRVNLDSLGSSGPQQQPIGGGSGNSGGSEGGPSFNFGGISGVTGSAGLVISQALTLRAGTVAGGDGLVTTNDEGTRFTAAVETQIGSTFTISLALCNKSNSPLVGQIDLHPAMNISATKADDILGIGRVGLTSWKFNMASACDDLTPDLILTVNLPGGMAPGFGTITGALRQVAF